MKRIISLTLAALMLVTMLLSATSCEVSMEAMTSYTQLRDHLSETVGDNKPAALDHQAAGLNSASVSTVTLEGGDREVRALGYALTGNYVLQFTLTLNGSSEKAHALYEVMNVADGKVISSATMTVLLTHYTGDDTVVYLIEWTVDGKTSYNHYLCGYPGFDFESYKKWLNAYKEIIGE